MTSAEDLLVELIQEGWTVTISRTQDRSGAPVDWDPSERVFSVNALRPGEIRAVSGYGRGKTLSEALRLAGDKARRDEVDADGESRPEAKAKALETRKLR